MVSLCLCLYPCSGPHPGLLLSVVRAHAQLLIHLFPPQKVDTRSRHLALTSEMAVLIHSLMLQIWKQEVGSFSDALVEPSENPRQVVCWGIFVTPALSLMLLWAIFPLGEFFMVSTVESTT